MRRWRHAVILPAALAGLSLVDPPALAQVVEPPPTIEPLGNLQPPAPPDGQYDALVKNKAWLVALGKALFWDSAVGSDGQACASCHFHAGADPRIVNQLSPGLRAVPNADDKFGGTVAPFPLGWSPSGSAGLTRGGFLDHTGKAAAPNITLAANDFPFHQLKDVNDRESEILYDTNDVTSSQGVFDGLFIGLRRNVKFRTKRRDFCRPGDDNIFTVNINGVPKKVRKVEPRNTPTAINAAFFFRNFWDGRANNIFNGVNPFGRRGTVNDPTVRIVSTLSPGVLQLEVLELPNSSLASQAVGPPNSNFEMACGGRGFPDIGRKLLGRTPLAGQRIAGDDSVFGAGSTLGSLIRRSGKGLRVTYLNMVQNAFQDGLWNGPGTYKISSDGQLLIDAAGYVQPELNFSLFFGLAVDAYERTLISNRTEFDLDPDLGGTATPAGRGKQLFLNEGKCVNCHTGPLLSGAAVPPRQPEELIENMIIGDGGRALYDGGFYNIGVRPTFEDVGVGDKDPYNVPLSFTRQFTTGPRVDPFPDPRGGGLDRIAVDGAFKTPSLRNVALTAPYFHNGGESNLHDVVRFYNRGGNRRGQDGNDTTGTGPLGQSAPVGPNMGGSNLDADIQPLGLSEAQIDDLVAFLKALTDRRVSCHRAPFDHPELVVSNGSQLIAVGARAKDARLRLVAAGRNGYPAGWCDPNTGDLFDRNLIGGMLQPMP